MAPRTQSTFVPAASVTVTPPAGTGASLALPSPDVGNVSLMIQNGGGLVYLNWGAPAGTATNGLMMLAGDTLILSGPGPWSTAATVAAQQNPCGPLVFTRGTVTSALVF